MSVYPYPYTCIIIYYAATLVLRVLGTGMTLLEVLPLDCGAMPDTALFASMLTDLITRVLF